VVSRRSIAVQSGTTRPTRSLDTIDVHMARLRPSSRERARIETIRGSGYRIIEQ